MSSSTAQSSALTQVAGAGAGGVTVGAVPVSFGGTTTTAAQTGFATPDAFFAWVAALASDLAATVQTSVEVQVAACLAHCTGGVQSQAATQRADVIQVAVAAAGPQIPVAAPAAAGPPAAAAPIAAAGATRAAARAPRAVARRRSHARRARHATVVRHRPLARRMCLRLTLHARVPKASGPRLLLTIGDLHFAQRFSCDHRSIGR